MTDVAPPTPAVGPPIAVRLGRGDTDAMRDLYREYGRAVYAVAYRTLGNRTQAEEAQQQTFVQAWKAAASFDPTRDPGPWLFTIAKRAAIDIYRREVRRDHDDLDAVRVGDLPPSPASEPGFPHWEIRRVVDSLPVDERAVVRLQHFGGLTHNEIAERLAIPIGTVKSRSAHAHRRLATELDHLREDVA